MFQKEIEQLSHRAYLSDDLQKVSAVVMKVVNVVTNAAAGKGK